MIQLAVLRTKYIPWKHLEKFNQIAHLQVPRYETNTTRPGLLGRSYFHLGENDSGIVQAYQTSGKRGFYVGLAYHGGMQERHPEIRKIASRIRKATRETTGRKIRTYYVDLPLTEPESVGENPDETAAQKFAFIFSALELTS